MAAGNKLRMGNMTVGIEWLTPGQRLPKIAMGARLIDILKEARAYGPEQIEAAGLTKAVQDAEATREKIINRAARALAPLRIGEDELRRLVDAQMAR